MNVQNIFSTHILDAPLKNRKENEVKTKLKHVFMMNILVVTVKSQMTDKEIDHLSISNYHTCKYTQKRERKSRSRINFMEYL